MALTPSRMLPLGTVAPAFSLPDTQGRTVSIDDLPASAPLLVMFICNHCPYVKLVRSELARLGKDYQDRIGIVAISSNDVTTHPQDSPERMKEEAAAAGYTFPYLYDADQSVARAYQAACTPDFFVFDAERKLVYRGQLDGSRPGNGQPVTGTDLRAALDAVLAGKPVSSHQHPSLGCNIKWKPGTEPE